jgi:hypothetical protein
MKNPNSSVEAYRTFLLNAREHGPDKIIIHVVEHYADPIHRFFKDNEVTVGPLEHVIDCGSTLYLDREGNLKEERHGKVYKFDASTSKERFLQLSNEWFFKTTGRTISN